MNIWIGGSFDYLHAGHLALFEEATRLAHLGERTPGRTVTVAVNSDEFIGRFKAQPVQTLSERLAMVAAVRWVDAVQVNDGSDQAGLILAAHADVILVGDDWAPPRDYLGQLSINQNWLDEHRIDVRFLPRVGGWSSTMMKARAGARRMG